MTDPDPPDEDAEPDADAQEDGPLDEARVDELADDLDALSNPRRLHLLQILTQPRYREEVGDALGMSRQAASRHIERLLEQGFIRELDGWRETGPVKEYQVVPQRLFGLGIRLGNLGRLKPEGGRDEGSAPRTEEIPGDDEIEVPADPRDRETTQLLVVNGPEAGTTLPLAGDEGRWTLGRDEDRDLHLDWDPYVSARHGEIHLDMQGHVLVDTHSSNGTFLNFKRLPTGERVQLRKGDVIKVGHTVLVYQEEG